MSAAGISLSDAVSGGLPGMAKQFGGLQAKTDENIKAEKSAAASAQSDIAKSEAEKATLLESARQPGGGLSPPKLAPPPQKKATQPIEMWGSAAMWAAALGGLLTRRPLINSLNAAGAVMNAFRQQDSEAAKTAFETWKVENDNAIKMFEFANNSLKEELSAIHESENTRLNNYKIVAQALGDEQAARMQTFEQAMKLVEERQRHADEMTKAAPEIQTKYAQLQSGLAVAKAAKELHAAKQSGDPAKIEAAASNYQGAQEVAQGLNLGLGKGGSAASGGSFSPEMGQLMAALAEKGVSLPTGFRSKAQQIQLYQGILDRNQGKTPDEIADLLKTGQIEFGAQKKETQTAAAVAGKVEVAQNEIKRFAPLVREASAKVPRGNFVPLTRLMQTADASISDPNLRSLKIRINSLLNAYDMLAARGGTDKDKRQEVRGLLLSADSPEVLEAALDSFTLEADAAHAAAVDATRVPELDKPGFKPSHEWPSAKGVSDGKVLKDAQGQVVARAKGGEWGPP